jgi:predicted DsbA family dithiol-disulfide isomerase
VGTGDLERPTVYFDFLCPWAYRAAMWLQAVEDGGRIQPEWRFFSLSENHRTREAQGGAPVWEGDGHAPGVFAFRAAIAARRQGEAEYRKFRVALQKARHEGHLKADLPDTHRQAAQTAGLDVERFSQDLTTVDLSALAQEHSEAVRRGVFGVPTLVWPNGRSYYVKITEVPAPDRAVALYDAIAGVHEFGEVIEIKTPESEGTLPA